MKFIKKFPLCFIMAAVLLAAAGVCAEDAGSGQDAEAAEAAADTVKELTAVDDVSKEAAADTVKELTAAENVSEETAETAEELEEPAAETAGQAAEKPEDEGEKTGTAAEEQEKQPVQDEKRSSMARIQVTDMAGNEIALDEPVKSIVAINPADCEVLFDIGAADLLVGRGEYCDYPAEALEIECVQADDKIDLARVIKLKPEILVVNSTALTEEEARAVTAAGIRIVISDPKVIEEIYTAIFNLAELTGKVEEAEEILDHMMDTFDALREAAKESSSPEDKKSIYFEISPLKFGLWTAGKGTFMNEIAEMLNLKNIFSDKTGYKEVTEKEVTGRNPDYIVTVAKAIGEGPTPEEEILTRQGWEYVNAIYFEAILNMPDSELTRPVPRLADAAREIFNYIYNGIV